MLVRRDDKLPRSAGGLEMEMGVCGGRGAPCAAAVVVHQRVRVWHHVGMRVGVDVGVEVRVRLDVGWRVHAASIVPRPRTRRSTAQHIVRSIAAPIPR